MNKKSCKNMRSHRLYCVRASELLVMNKYWGPNEPKGIMENDMKTNTTTVIGSVLISLSTMSGHALAQDSVVAAFHADVPSLNGFGYRVLNEIESPVPGIEQLDPFSAYDQLSTSMEDTYFETAVTDLSESTRQVRMRWHTNSQSVPFLVPSTTFGGEVIENAYFFLGWTNADSAEDGGYVDPEFGEVVSVASWLTNSNGSSWAWDFQMDEFENGFTGWAGWGGPDSTVYQIAQYELIVNYTIERELCAVDLDGDGVLGFFDVNAFLQAYGNNDSVADFTGDGRFDFFDVSAFLQAFATGCP